MASPPLTVGLGLKPEHIAEARAASAPGLWFEVHAENYMVEGGPRLQALLTVRELHPVALHGVAMSLAGITPPDGLHLARLSALVRRIEPTLVSEHLAWSGQAGIHLPDLLPFPRTHAALARITAHVAQVQDALGCAIAIENPSHYLPLDGHDYDEIEFLAELVRRSGCRLLLDVNNVFVSARNLGFDARQWLERFFARGLAGHVAEIHLAGHSADPALGEGLLVDSHDAPVAPEVWALYRQVLACTGTRPTLIERDAHLPAFGVLMEERRQAHGMAATADAPDRAVETCP